MATKELIDTLLAISVVAKRLATNLAKEELKNGNNGENHQRLSALTAALQEFTEQTTNGYINTFEEIYNPEKDEPKETQPAEQPSLETKTVTYVELRSRLAEISRAGHTAESRN